MPYKTNELRRKHNSNPEIRERLNAYKREWYAKHADTERTKQRGRVRTPEARRLEYLKAKASGKIRKYSYSQTAVLRRKGVTVEWYNATLAAQGGGCAICSKHETRRKMSVDHNHTTGANRGLLCSRCNTALERMETVENWHEKALAYLVKYEIAQREKEFK